jgi:hypothetical protein
VGSLRARAAMLGTKYTRKRNHFVLWAKMPRSVITNKTLRGVKLVVVPA